MPKSPVPSFRVIALCIAVAGCDEDPDPGSASESSASGGSATTGASVGTTSGGATSSGATSGTGPGGTTSGGATSGGTTSGSATSGGTASSSTASSGTASSGTTSSGPEFDPQSPPADPVEIEQWLTMWKAKGWESQWFCEPEPTAKTEGAPAIHAHSGPGGKNRVCSNEVLAAARTVPVPKGSASVKFFGDQVAVAVKHDDDSDAGKGWYWYEGKNLEGMGLALCVGCHGGAGSDADHPGLGDYVYFQVKSP